ncbi:hypothetical protein ALP12_200387 [Pseudomonas savastanoi pv. phaseolicola]|uniref:Ubiquitin-like protease family profile domain-containing protein n=2 Tax=Pseudomonas savastanoi TaxID=29438 RepID=A0A3M3G0B0_PSESG|nr:C48 family peptidase [Pseudomonas savastanoi]KPB44726.1 Xanthomonas outer protein D [Pseudomonas savastanoi pv. phaseolicola]KPY21596.1 Xanthomonas outer protein D [Pseudomonas savastanoi pv. phaseolicola]MBN4174112.1 hypothetical protein [Pseudomonas savastanoi pv. phaseolicola]RMM67667.1 hypothetical protein ALQ73_200196 [Pseudomonas savastanoi pv. glycinea]RMR92506.1 hypothetical protein ALP76_200079 [Pseudomonas savastanoi pv. glycinea]
MWNFNNWSNNLDAYRRLQEAQRGTEELSPLDTTLTVQAEGMEPHDHQQSHRYLIQQEEYRGRHLVEHAEIQAHAQHVQSLPLGNPTQAHVDSSVHRMRAAAPKSEIHRDYSEIFNIIERYGNGENLSELKIIFPGFNRFLTSYGLSHAGGLQMFRNLSRDQRDRLIHQIRRRIDNLLGPEYRAIALRQLEADCSSALAEDGAENRKIIKEYYKGVFETIIALLPRYEAGEQMSSIRQVNSYLRGDGSYSKKGLELLEHATHAQKNKLDRAIKRRQHALSKKAKEVKQFKVAFRALYKNPDLLLEISRKLSNRMCSINDASSGYLSQSELEKIVDEETGELSSLGEKIISGAPKDIQLAIRANFRIRYQQPEMPLNSPARSFHPQEENLPAPSFFSGVSTDWRRMGYQPEPGTPQYPPQSPASTFGGLSSLSDYGREFDLSTPQQEQPWNTYGDYGTQAPMSPERIDVDNLPSPQYVEDPELPQVTQTSWLLDGHLHAYTYDLARRLQGESNAHLLHFADSQVVTMLNSEDEAQRDVALRRLVGDADNPAPPIVFMPINRDNVHWSLLVVDRRDNHSPAAYHYDSMGTPHPHQHWHAQMAAWRLGLDASQVNKMPTAIQPDGYSCGDHVLTGIEVLAHRVIDGMFDYAGGKDLSDINPDRSLIRDRLAPAEQAPAESSVRSVPEPSVEQKKKKSKWWKLG